MAEARKRRRSTRASGVPWPISVRQMITYRDPITGRAVKTPRPGQRFRKGMRPKQERRMVQFDKRGKMMRTVELLGAKKVIKTSIANMLGSVDHPFRPEREHGLIDPALAATNVLNRLKGAKIITMLFTGQRPDGHRLKFKKQMFTVGVKSLRDMMVRGILDTLRGRGYRTNYNLDLVDWNSLTPDFRAGVRVNSKTFVRRLTPIRDFDIHITLER